jgi:YbbR domain-containing protein
MDDWRRNIKRNWLYMLTGALISVFLWVAVSADTVAQQTIPTELVVYATDPGFVLTETDPSIEEVSVLFTGRAGDLAALSVSRPQILVTIDRVESDSIDVALTPGMVKGRGNRELIDVRAVSVRPDGLRLHFQPRIEKLVSVVPMVNLTFANGFAQADSIRAEPGAVQVSGPEAAVADIDSVVTRLVDRERLRESISVEVPLELDDPTGQVELSSTSVRVSVAVEPRDEQVFIGVPVVVVGAGRENFRVEPSLVDVRISGPMSAVQSIRSEALTPLIEMTGAADFGTLLPILLSPPGPFMRVTIDPDSARVERVESAN